MAEEAPIAERVRSGSAEARLEALLAAMEQPPDEALVAAVTATLDDEHPGLRQAALEAVGRFATFGGHTFELAVLERAVQLTMDDSARVRAEAASTLAQLHDDLDHAPRLQALRRLLRDDEPGVRQEAAAALGDLRDAEAADALAERLEDSDAGVRFEAAFALAGLRDARARPHLEGALRQTRVRLDAMKALGMLGDEASIDPLERFASRWFLGWADRLTAYATLYRLGRRGYAEKILARTSSRNVQERTYAVALIGSHTIEEGATLLVTLAEDPAAPLRETAIDALGALGREEHAGVLERIARDDSADPTTRRVAQDALLKLS
ncbi:MAG: HEAT repeat domain-containing protein [Deltaproteobacteria bacterium]